MQKEIVTRKNTYKMSTSAPSSNSKNSAGTSQLQTEVNIQQATKNLTNGSEHPENRPARNNKQSRPRGRRNQAELDFSGSSEDDALPPPRRPAPAVDGLDPLERAMKMREQAQGQWTKHDPNLAGSDACTLRETHLLFKKLPEHLAGLIKVGPRPLEDFLTNLGALVVKWGSIRDDMLYRPVGGDVAKTNRTIEASLDVLTKFRENYNQISNSPSAISSIISFFQDPVMAALLGAAQVEESVAQLKAFSRNNRTLAAMSFSSLLKWKPAHVFRSQGNKRKYGDSYQYNRQGRTDRGGDKGDGRGYKQTRM